MRQSHKTFLLWILLILLFFVVWQFLSQARNEERLLDNEFERLKSDKQSQATPLRVEKTARDKLAMRSATPAVTQYISRAAPASAAAGSNKP